MVGVLLCLSVFSISTRLIFFSDICFLIEVYVYPYFLRDRWTEQSSRRAVQHAKYRHSRCRPFLYLPNLCNRQTTIETASGLMDVFFWHRYVATVISPRASSLVRGLFGVSLHLLVLPVLFTYFRN